MQPDPLRRSPAPLAGDQLEILRRVGDRPHQERLDDALLADRLREAVEFGLGEMAARLKRRGPDRLDRHRARAAEVAPDARATLAEQRREAAPEGRPFCPGTYSLDASNRSAN